MVTFQKYLNENQPALKKHIANYRLKDPFGNKETLSVWVLQDGRLKYSLYGSWQGSGTPFAIDNLQITKELPQMVKKNSKWKFLDKFIRMSIETGTEKIEKVDVTTEDLTPPMDQSGAEMTAKDAITLLKTLKPNQKVKIMI